MSRTITLTWGEYLEACTVGIMRRAVAEAKDSAKAEYLREPSIQAWADRVAREIQGAAAERAFARYLNTYLHGGFLNPGGEKARPDVGNVEVRWTGRRPPVLIVRPHDPPDRLYALLTGEAPCFEVLGWLPGTEARRDEWWDDPNGRGAAWWVPASALIGAP